MARKTPKNTLVDSDNHDLQHGGHSFQFGFGTDAVIQAKIGVHKIRVDNIDNLDNEGLLRLNQDLLEEVRGVAQIRVSTRQRKVAQYYNKKVKHRKFKVGNLVLRSTKTTKPLSKRKKMSPS